MFKRNILLKDYTTFKIGGRARYFFGARSKEELRAAVSWAKENRVPFFVLGGGSNLLVADEGYKGMVIKMQNAKCKIQNYNAKFKIIYAEAGVKLASLVSLLPEKSLTNLEWAAGIPGTVGGAIFGNTGAFGSSMADVVKSVEVLDVSRLKSKNYQLKDCQFAYKDSIFKKNKNLLILSVILQLSSGTQEEIQQKIKYFLDYRKKNHPLNFPSAGSIFKNKELRIKNQKMFVQFPELKEFAKQRLIPAGWLIERCGLKGKRVGRAQISEKHANFIINLGGASSKDVLKLLGLIKKEVKKKFGLELEEEITILR